MKTAIACLLLTTLPAWAAPTAADLERTLTGTWAGALEYRDYQSNGRVQLPMQVQLQLGPDGATLTRKARFDDGPQTGFVHITTVSLFDAHGTRVSSATFRKGRAVEAFDEDALVLQHQSDQQWTVAYTRRGTDGGADADIRITQTRQGRELRAVKEVKRPGEPDSAYAFRNQTVLVLKP